MLFGLVAAIWGFAVGAQPFSDNSFFTHLATGRLILARGAVPSSDPYSFTAPGSDWVVQSWLVSWLYAFVEALTGALGLRVLVGLVSGIVGVLVWRLTAPAKTLVGRLVPTGLVLAIGSEMWSARPLIVGLALLCVALLAAESRVDPRWLVPAFWVWVNSHGSFPLGLVAIGCFALGRALDGQRPEAEMRALRWAAVGTVAGVVSPVGPKLLLFPVGLLQRTDVLHKVVEWSSPDFSALYARIFLVELVVAVLVLVRVPRWRLAVPLVVFTAAALLALRNIAVASIVLVPGIARGLCGVGSVRSQDRSPVLIGAAAVVVTGLAFASVGLLGRPSFDLTSYPTRGVAWVAAEGRLELGHRVLSTDITANLLELLEGASASVYFDDRVDMFPPQRLRDYVALLQGKPGWQELLDRCSIDTVIWDRNKPLVQLLAGSDDWRIAYQDHSVAVAERRRSVPEVPNRC
ncbi:MAG: hypothetical protein N2037_03565 [Acidimicrobiales bacterium]|nr:hypothetical protein [Acidimicrobiales bacterium]